MSANPSEWPWGERDEDWPQEGLAFVGCVGFDNALVPILRDAIMGKRVKWRADQVFDFLGFRYRIAELSDTDGSIRRIEKIAKMDQDEEGNEFMAENYVAARQSAAYQAWGDF